jgi:hypothetical protein
MGAGCRIVRRPALSVAMTTADQNGPVDRIIDSLQERAKELNCLYRVHDLVVRSDVPVDEICRSLIELLPTGWQYPSACWARITVEDARFEPPRAQPTPWAQRAEIRVEGEPAGAVEVFYTREFPAADEGPFLAEERRLIEAIATTLAVLVIRRRLHAELRHVRTAASTLASPARPAWWVIVEFLRQTDHHLLMRVSRRMINYLCWNGVEEAQQLLERFAHVRRPGETATLTGENRPAFKTSRETVLATADEAFRIAAGHLTDDEILSSLRKWIKDDKSGFLIETVENQGSSLTDIAEALERHQQLALGDRDLSRAMQLAIRASLIRRFFTDDLEYINIAKHWVEVDDFHPLVAHVISPSGSHGKLGGKSSGLFLAERILRKTPEYAQLLGEVRVPRTWYLTSDALLDFIDFNHLEDIYDRKYLELDQVRREYPHIVQVFKNSTFSPEIVKGLAVALDDFEERPLIVRSSSLLEDRVGSAFSGKYKSLFLANQGSKEERLAALMDAIAEVYASVFGPDPIEYRAERGLLDVHEEMGVMIQEVVGARVGRYFMPAFAGVAFSNNEFRWSARIKRDDGLIRLVPGLGTRAVDRVGDDYPVLIAPGQPGLRANVTPDEVVRYAPARADLINLETRQFETVEVARLARECGRDLPGFFEVFSALEDDRLHAPAALGFDATRTPLLVTFEGLTRNTPFISQMRALLRVLRERLGYPVDLEFASDGQHLYLLQCRPQSFSHDIAPAQIPADLPADRIVFAADRFVSNGRVPDLTHVVYVSPEAYSALPDLDSLTQVGRAVGRLNSVLPRRQFALIGPGRWGSRGDVRLGVSVTYSDINNTALLMEVAARRGNYVPEVSFGTHFFQDLVEAEIRYLPLFPGEAGQRFHPELLTAGPNRLADLAPDFAHLAGAIHVADVPCATGGLVLRVLMNGDADRAVGYFAQPDDAAPEVGGEPRREGEPDDHWRWRLRMVQQLAAALVPGRFGVKAIYLTGSTSDSTAGPTSDIDLIVHVSEHEQERAALECWLEGWSRCLAEMNALRTGHRIDRLLDVQFVTDANVAEKVGPGARPLELGRGAQP